MLHAAFVLYFSRAQFSVALCFLRVAV